MPASDAERRRPGTQNARGVPLGSPLDEIALHRTSPVSGAERHHAAAIGSYRIIAGRRQAVAPRAPTEGVLRPDRRQTPGADCLEICPASAASVDARGRPGALPRHRRRCRDFAVTLLAWLGDAEDIRPRTSPRAIAAPASPAPPAWRDRATSKTSVVADRSSAARRKMERMRGEATSPRRPARGWRTRRTEDVAFADPARGSSNVTAPRSGRSDEPRMRPVSGVPGQPAGRKTERKRGWLDAAPAANAFFVRHSAETRSRATCDANAENLGPLTASPSPRWT